MKTKRIVVSIVLETEKETQHFSGISLVGFGKIIRAPESRRSKGLQQGDREKQALLSSCKT